MDEIEVDEIMAPLLAAQVEAELKVELGRPGLHIAYGTDPMSNTYHFRVQDVERQEPPEQAVADAVRDKMAKLTPCRVVVHCIGNLVVA